MLLNNEIEVLVAVKELGRANKFTISRKLGISTGWANDMLNNLALKGCLVKVASGRHSEVYELSPTGKEALVAVFMLHPPRHGVVK